MCVGGADIIRLWACLSPSRVNRAYRTRVICSGEQKTPTKKKKEEEDERRKTRADRWLTAASALAASRCNFDRSYSVQEIRTEEHV